MTEIFEPVDTWDRRLALRASGRLAALNRAGVLTAADVHVADRLGRLGQEHSADVLLAVALTVRAVRHGSVCLDLATTGELVGELGRDVPGDLHGHPSADAAEGWPETDAWVQAVAASPLTGQALRLEGTLLYLDRYWQEEGAVVDDLLIRAARTAPSVDEQRLEDALDRLFPDASWDEQRRAARASARRWTSVLTGGPGTGKTTTLARLLAALAATADAPLRIALAAPTGKAAARMTQALVEAVHAETFPAVDRGAVEGLAASTLHRLLGVRPDNGTRFRHHRGNRLPHDVVVVDETSMVSLTLMARLLEAVRPDARLLLVGDADQLASVEAGAVLQDIVRGFEGRSPSPVSELVTSHRFGDEIGALAAAVRDGDADRAWSLLAAGSGAVELVDPDDEARIRALVEPPAVELRERARAGDAAGALEALRSHRLLCAHREGPWGVGGWNDLVERWLQEHDGRDWLPDHYGGRPLIVNANDYGLRLWNGDTGVVVGDDASERWALFDDGAAGRRLSLARLSDVTTAHAMTVHRSQGSQFDTVTVLLPEEDSLLLTRELFYTALTRARSSVRVVGSEQSVRAAVHRRALRATGLAGRLHRT
ncbi:MAG TPA: exodeoxyribonuclease V subunit alpha [Marmoricola sp.]|nr:exodeoxyribonuclease V subunit alpha [Marmoricola sp.]